MAEAQPSHNEETIDVQQVPVTMSQETINALNEERYRVLEAKVNKVMDKVESVDNKADSNHKEVKDEMAANHAEISSQISQLSIDIKTSEAKDNASTRRTIITTVGGLAASLLTLSLVLLYIFL